MGYESDFLITSAIGQEDAFIAAIGPSLDECARSNVVTKEDAIKYLSSKVIPPIIIVLEA